MGRGGSRTFSSLSTEGRRVPPGSGSRNRYAHPCIGSVAPWRAGHREGPCVVLVSVAAGAGSRVVDRRQERQESAALSTKHGIVNVALGGPEPSRIDVQHPER
jgi:hypothetical protein